MKLHESKSTSIKLLLNFPEIDPRDTFIVLYLVATKLNAKILKVTETIRKTNLISGELFFKIPKKWRNTYKYVF